MNRKAIFAALFIAVMAMSAIYASPAAATPQSVSTPQRNLAPALTLVPSLNYTIQGTLIAYIDASGYLLITTNIPGFGTLNITIRQLYLGIKITVSCDKISVNPTTGKGGAVVSITSDLVGKANLYASIGPSNYSTVETISHHYATIVSSTFFVPFGSNNKTFTGLFPTLGPEETVNSTAKADPLQIHFANNNVTSDGIQYATVHHTVWDFSSWMEQKVNSTLNSIWGKFVSNATAYFPGVQGGFNVVTSVGRIDIWKGNGTDHSGNSVSDILLGASALINLLVKFSVVGQGAVNLGSIGHNYSANYNVNFHATFGIYFALTVTTDYFTTHNVLGNNLINTYTITVPENATLVKRNVTVIVYFGSPAHGIDVTAGGQRGNTTFGGQRLFFVDYGWDGAPEFETDGTSITQLGNATGTVSGTGTTRTVTVTKGTGTWVYFNLDVTGYGIKDVKRNDGVTLNSTQYWMNNGVLYVCDDPAYSYTVDLIGAPSGGLGTNTILLIGVVAVIAVLALVVLIRRRSGSSGVSVKAI